MLVEAMGNESVLDDQGDALKALIAGVVSLSEPAQIATIDLPGTPPTSWYRQRARERDSHRLAAHELPFPTAKAAAGAGAGEFVPGIRGSARPYCTLSGPAKQSGIDLRKAWESSEDRLSTS